MIKQIASACLLTVCTLGYATAHAQTLYKSTLPDGRVIYGDKPAPDAVKVEATKPDTSRKGVQTIAPGDRNRLNTLEEERLKREGAGARVGAAEKTLRDAEAALAAGQEPLPAERSGTAGKGSQLNEAYWQRQQRLKDDVQKARADLDQARAAAP